ncbi:uncharacterized protein BO87DRAFT_1672 [Aspergillus neoniger CBS 115656]|uniref:Uncharacterized protein n=1 Tax=Aspergillus neoniger (strain CBS 115656) TaxID=1448310 RepID=A0A318ZVE8_ASPNB|nr:hypothetical protein BO87DRAFT_1672 [Aspergillus neoniger CBS 115656]PYH39542.1 hypothetical protein BO87DRAFT_1672 [Aspergillus neoniger CBS 115656]
MTVVGRHSHSLPLTLYSTFVVPGLSFPSPSFLTTTTITTTTTTTTTTYYSSLLSLFSPLPKENNNLPAYSSIFDLYLVCQLPNPPTQLPPKVLSSIIIHSPNAVP